MSNWDVRVDVVDLESIRDRVNAAQQTQGDVKDLVAIADGAGREIDRLRADLQSLQARVAMLEGALRAWEQWEADIIIDRSCWETTDGLPHLTQEMWDKVIGLQQLRNAALSVDPSPIMEVVKAAVARMMGCRLWRDAKECPRTDPFCPNAPLCRAIANLLEQHPEWGKS